MNRGTAAAMKSIRGRNGHTPLVPKKPSVAAPKSTKAAADKLIGQLMQTPAAPKSTSGVS
jgi:hypothetical protein